jgi:hypothetical protein
MPEIIGTYTVYLKAEADTEEEAIEKIQNLAWQYLLEKKIIPSRRN